jgi:hypothetical protein
MTAWPNGQTIDWRVDAWLTEEMIDWRIDWLKNWLIFEIANIDVSDKRCHKGMLNLTKVRFETHDWVVDWLNRRGGIPQARGRMPTDMTCLNSEWVVDRLKIIEERFPRWEMVDWLKLSTLKCLTKKIVKLSRVRFELANEWWWSRSPKRYSPDERVVCNY